MTPPDTPFHEAVAAAAARIRPHIWETLLEPSPALGVATGLVVYLKLECLQITRSFKVRGALNALLQLPPGHEVVAASTGNHGLAVAYGMARLGVRGEIVLPETVAPAKRARLEEAGATLRFHGQDGVETERYARALSERTGRAFISPYNDPAVVSGQGTVGPEIRKRLPDVDVVFVPVGGGGLIGGIAGYLKAVAPWTRVVGCLPANSPVMLESVRAGRIVDMPTAPTLSDGTAGGIEAGAITFNLCQSHVDDWVVVSEDQIRAAMRQVFDAHGIVIEGAAGVAVAAMKDYAGRHPALRGARAVAILCGGNIDLDLFLSIVR